MTASRYRDALVAFASLAALSACSSSRSPRTPSSAPTSTGARPASTSPSTSVPPVRVTVTPFPFWDSTTITAAPALLDSYAAAYEQRLAGAAPSIPRFLFGVLPVAAFDDIFTNPGDAMAKTGGYLWLFYVSGYFGGVWLRGEIDRAQPGTSRLANVRVAPTEQAFRASAAAAQVGVDAAMATDGTAALAYGSAALLPDPTKPPSFTGSGLAQNMGYNEGYLLQILDKPPAGLATPDRYRISCPANGLFACTYNSPKSKTLQALASVEQALNDASNAEYRSLFLRLQPLQAGKVPSGRLVWNGGLSVQGFPQESYDQLLDVSSSYLEDVQATALATVKAVVTKDGALARSSALANACLGVWLNAYATGLTQGAAADLPTFGG